MRIFRSKTLRRIVSPLLLVCSLVLLDTVVGNLLRPVAFADWFNHDIQRIESSGQQADMVFIGASRTHYTFVPRVFQEKMGLGCVVNAASAGQVLSATKWELQDLIDRIHPHRVFIGVTWNGLKSTGALQNRLIVYDRLSLKNRLGMAADCFALDELPYLSLVYRFKDNFLPQTIRSIWKDRRELAGKNYQDSEHHNGFVFRTGTWKTGSMPIDTLRRFSEAVQKKRNLRDLDACIALCKGNGIDVTLVSGVTSVMRLYAVGNYQGAVDYIARYAGEKQVDYYNLNYLVGREDFLPDELMYDTNHANGDGAVAVSERFAEILLKADAGEDVSPYFYKNLDALKQDVHRIVAVNAAITQAEPGYTATITSLQNDDVQPLYRLLARWDEKQEFTLLQDWTAETEIAFTVPTTENCTVKIEAAAADDDTVGRATHEYRFDSLGEGWRDAASKGA